MSRAVFRRVRWPAIPDAPAGRAGPGEVRRAGHLRRALGISDDTGRHWLREVQGGQFGRGGDVDGMPRLGDDVGPGSDLRFKVTQDVAAGEGARVADREQQAVLIGEVMVVRRDSALLTGPDPGGGLDEHPLGCCQGCRGPLVRGHRGEGRGRRDLPSLEGSGVSLAGKADVVGRLAAAFGEDRHDHAAAREPGAGPLAEVDFVADPVGVVLARAVALVGGLSRCDRAVEADPAGICVVVEAAIRSARMSSSVASSARGSSICAACCM